MKVKEVAKAETPTLVKYADAVPYLVETCKEIRELETGEFETWRMQSGVH